MALRKEDLGPSNAGNKTELQFWSRYVRDELSPSVAGSSSIVLSQDRVARLEDFLGELKDTNIDEGLLRFSKIHTALLEITRNKGKWPHELVEKTETILRRWEKQLGNLLEIKQDLWTAGGRMAGLFRLKRWDELRDSSRGSEDHTDGEKWSKTVSHWTVKDFKMPGHCFRSGHNGFTVGEYDEAILLLRSPADDVVGGSNQQPQLVMESFTLRRRASRLTRNKHTPSS